MSTLVQQGMSLKQLIVMLTAAEAQGATKVMLGVRREPGVESEAPVDWVSMQPVDGCVYVGALGELGSWQNMGNEALESIDW